MRLIPRHNTAVVAAAAILLLCFAAPGVLCLRCNTYARAPAAGVTDATVLTLGHVDFTNATYCTKLVYTTTLPGGTPEYHINYGSDTSTDAETCRKGIVAKYEQQGVTTSVVSAKLVTQYCCNTPNCNTPTAKNNSLVFTCSSGVPYEVNGTLLKKPFKVHARNCKSDCESKKETKCRVACNDAKKPGCAGYIFRKTAECELYRTVEAVWKSPLNSTTYYNACRAAVAA